MTDQDAKTLFLEVTLSTQLYVSEFAKAMQSVAEHFIFEPVTQELTATMKEAFTDCLQQVTHLRREEFRRFISVEVTNDRESGLRCQVMADPSAPDWLKTRFRILLSNRGHAE